MLQGRGELTRARLYRTVCTLRDQGGINDEALWELAQEPTTCLLELLLLCQDTAPELLDQLDEDQGRLVTLADLPIPA